MSDDIPSASGIYKITCTANGKIYIGSAANLRKRKSDHFRELGQNVHHNPHLQRAWNKYGEAAFIFEVWELVLPMSLTAREQYWFNRLKPFGRRGFNIAPTAGSSLGMECAPATREKLRQINIGRKNTPEHAEKLRQANLGNKYMLGKPEPMRGRKQTPEANKKNRQAHLGKKQMPEHIEKVRQAGIGHEVTPKTREKIGNANRGKKHTPESRENMRQAHLGKKLSPEAREKLTGRKLSPEHAEKLRSQKRGANGRFI